MGSLRPEWFRDSFTFIKPCCVDGEPDAQTVWIRAGNQSFSLDGYRETKEEAEWMRLMLGKAFAAMAEDTIQRCLSAKVERRDGATSVSSQTPPPSLPTVPDAPKDALKEAMKHPGVKEYEEVFGKPGGAEANTVSGQMAVLGDLIAREIFRLGDEGGSPCRRIQFKVGKWPYDERNQGGIALQPLAEHIKRILSENLPKSASASEFSKTELDAQRATTVKGQTELKWFPTAERLPEVCQPVIGYADRWVDSEYNEMGMRECFRNDDYWLSAAWNNYQDCWDAAMGAPEYWTPYPEVPLSANLQDARAASDGKERGEKNPDVLTTEQRKVYEAARKQIEHDLRGICKEIQDSQRLTAADFSIVINAR
jgi:hypothetical protein